jgi:predicted membrane protein
MTPNDIKLGIFNSISLMISFTHVENSLKIILLLASIIYTFQKIYEGYKKRNAKNDKKL